MVPFLSLLMSLMVLTVPVSVSNMSPYVYVPVHRRCLGLSPGHSAPVSLSLLMFLSFPVSPCLFSVPNPVPDLSLSCPCLVSDLVPVCPCPQTLSSGATWTLSVTEKTPKFLV
ncbi:hypothetical protein WMY93_031985 [Mugilogobius chulae]|uniref:Secreted protein n=1 Tax=Mugilogobius chulae TaxID=88201 RepID=A0AAW0MDR6_9GOBI